MRKLFVYILMSLDGYISGRDENEYWHNWNDEMGCSWWWQTVVQKCIGKP